MPRLLIVNADDFGHSAPVNAGVIEAYEQGIVTSASLMVRRPHAAEAATYARRNRRLDVGLHVELGEWRHDGRHGWVAVHEVESARIADEVAAQLELFSELVGRTPTHLDSHQHAHRDEPGLSALRAQAERLDAPLRHFTPGISYCGSFYGQDDVGRSYPEHVSTAALLDLVYGLPEGISELCCHPARGPAPYSPYSVERELELAALCDPEVVRAIEAAEIELVGFEAATAYLRVTTPEG